MTVQYITCSRNINKHACIHEYLDLTDKNRMLIMKNNIAQSNSIITDRQAGVLGSLLVQAGVLGCKLEPLHTKLVN